MEKVITFLCLFVFCIFPSEMNAKKAETNQVTLRRYHPIGGATRSSKVPSYNTISLEVSFDDSMNVLYFYDEDDNDVSFSIFDSEGYLKMSDVCNFNENHLFSSSVTLDSGTYTIVVLINNIEYIGTIDIDA